jgi:glycosyltransferase involved in cell wall biosynthesis
MKPVRLTVVQTHPVQYLAPWFRHIAAHCPEIDLTVVYASRPRPEQQGTGFGRPFEWDTSLLDGYVWKVVRESRDGDDFSTLSYRGLDVDGIGAALEATTPDVLLIPGWYSITMTRAIRWARVRGIPVIYRGDTNNAMAPRGWRGPLWHLKTRGLLSLYSGYLSVGRRSRQYLTSHGASPIHIHASPACVDNDAFAAGAAPHLPAAARAAARTRLGATPEDFVVLFAGKLEARKRPLDALRAVAALGANAVLAVAGSGPLDHELRTHAESRGVRTASLGFVNQSRLGEVYAAADCLVLPSDANESWGLVVNEAMATGLPAVVSDHVGCGPDLVIAGETGEVHRTGDVGDLVLALERVRARGGRTAMAEACRARIARYAYPAASTGLVAACQALVRRSEQPTRVIACCGGMVIVSGLERMTFEVLGVVRSHGGAVHCIVNDWENERIVELAERIGASWSTGFYWYPFTSRPGTTLKAFQMLWDIIRTSAGLARDSARFRPTHVLAPEHIAVLRNMLTLAVLRLLGVRVVFRLAMAPEPGPVQRVLWRHVLPPFVSRFVPNSRFGYRRLLERGVSESKITLIRNSLSRRQVSSTTDADVVRLAAERPTVLAVGQILPSKGTHLFVDAVLQLRREGFDVQGIVLGGIPRWPDDLIEYIAGIRERVEKEGAADRVHFVGGRENILEIMRASYLLATPFLGDETFGNVALEARSVGLPVVTFANGGLVELVEHGSTGYICDTADLDGLLRGLRWYLTAPAKRTAASVNSLRVTASPENDCTAREFERRWWDIFRAAGTPVAATIEEDLVTQ